MSAIAVADLVGALDEIAKEKIRRPVPVKDRHGRLHRDPSGEFDWFYALPVGERAAVSRCYMAPDGIDVDLVANWAGFDYVDDWADAFMAAVRAKRAETRRGSDVWSDEWLIDLLARPTATVGHAPDIDLVNGY